MQSHNILGKIIAISLVTTVGFFGVFVALEPEIASATNPQAITVTLNVTAGVTLTAGSAIAFDNAIDMSNNNAVGSTSLQTITNDAIGYTLKVHASAAPAMTSGTLSIPDITATPGTWGTVLTGNTTGFGFSGYNVGGVTDLNTTTFGTDTTCGAVNSVSSNLKWRGFNSTTDITLASRSATTTTAGATVVLCLAAGQSGTSFIPATSTAYTATLTATATTN